MTTIEDLMTPRVETIEGDATLRDAAARMREREIGLLVVRHGDKAVGTLTDRDIVVRAVARGVNPQATHVSEMMSPGVAAVREDADPRTALELLRELGAGRAAVVDDANHLSGVLTRKELAAFVEGGSD